MGSYSSGFTCTSNSKSHLIDVNTLLTLAATVFLVSYIEGFLFASEYAAKNKYKVDGNQELLALGVSNMAVGFFKAYQ